MKHLVSLALLLIAASANASSLNSCQNGVYNTQVPGVYAQVNVSGSRAFLTINYYFAENNRWFNTYLFESWGGSEAYANEDTVLHPQWTYYEPRYARFLAAGPTIEIWGYQSWCDANGCYVGYRVTDTFNLTLAFGGC